MAFIHVDGKEYEVEDEVNLLHACLSVGLDIPFFCWHPALGSVGACRMCAVKLYKDEQDEKGKIVMSCMTPVRNGLRLSIEDPEAKSFRKSVIEWLMINHPHDCPVCDEGGHCHLQDMTFMAGHDYRRHRFPKRTYRNQYLGPFLEHEMNRCIQCYRCVRFYRDYAGGTDLNVFGAHDRVYFGREKDGVLENEFSGNLAEVCPTGVFTDKTSAKHYARKWDLQYGPSVCVHCGVGCNISAGEREGTVRRIENRFNREVNGFFLCDRGRFGYEFLNQDSRIRRSIVRSGDIARETARDAALAEASTLLKRRERLIGIGSPRASVEANYLLFRLAGADRFFSGVEAEEEELAAAAARLLRDTPARSASLLDAAHADAVVILGEDLTNTAPIAALSLRQSVLQGAMAETEKLHIPRWDDYSFRNKAGVPSTPFFVLTPAATKLDDIASRVFRASPDEIAALGYAVAHEIDGESPPVDLTGEPRPEATEIARALMHAKRPLVVSGTHARSKSVLDAAANIASALTKTNRGAMISLAFSECNSHGLAILGGHPLARAAALLEAREADTVVVLENDLTLRGPEGHAVLAAAKKLIAIEHTTSKTTALAQVVLACGTYAESDGVLVNSEGRAQRFFKVLAPGEHVFESWRWLSLLSAVHGDERAASLESINDLYPLLAADFPVFLPLAELVPQKPAPISGHKIARQPHRFSGRTALHAAQSIFEPQPPIDRDAPLTFSMEGYHGRPDAAIVPYFRAPGWNSPQAVLKYERTPGAELRGGPTGKRLVDTTEKGLGYFAASLPERPRASEYICFPLYRIFGSEELSSLAPAVAERMPHDFAALNPQDGLKLGLVDGMQVLLQVDEEPITLSVRFDNDIAPGCVGYFLRKPRGSLFRNIKTCTIHAAGQ